MDRTQWYIGAPNGVVICIRENNDGELAGEFYHSYSSRPVPFQGIGQMTLRMEKLFDWLNFPYPGTNSRSFLPAKASADKNNIHPERKKIMSDEMLLTKHGEIGTFIVRVQHRQNSSWQGRITWMEEDKTVQFRSVWEMIKLIENAVDSVSESEEEEPEENWFSPQADIPVD
ncbi:MAG: hypothetical protein IJG58_05325 [Oscillospiraceae bacterium]|nr:hypothetical protein [Oscillospiraceae bacterium]